MTWGKLLLLGTSAHALIPWLESQGHEAILKEAPLKLDWIRAEGFDGLISYGYRHLIQKPVLKLFENKAVNLHISYLPWNRGADPNLWSFLEDTPKGVTIHYLDEGLDTGDIIVQKAMTFEMNTLTLATTYQQLHQAIQALFKIHWPSIRAGACERKKQSGAGSYHKASDKDEFAYLLDQGWDTSVAKLLPSQR